MNKTVCTIGSGLGSIMLMSATVGALAGILWVCVNLISKNVGDFFVSWILAPVMLIVLATFVGMIWWHLSKWLYGHCRKYWNK